MDRRKFLERATAAIAATTGLPGRPAHAAVKSAESAPPPDPANSTGVSGSFFPAGLKERDWVEFKSAGFTQSVTGVIFNSDNPPCCGVPLGGVSTGCVDIETNGTIGFNCLFDAYPRKPQMLEPLLGLAVGDQA